MIDTKQAVSVPCSVFSVKPSHGLIHDSQLLVLQLLPTENRVYKHILTCQLNATQHWDEVSVSGRTFYCTDGKLRRGTNFVSLMSLSKGCQCCTNCVCMSVSIQSCMAWLRGHSRLVSSKI